MLERTVFDHVDGRAVVERLENAAVVTRLP
jgi:hypothetical protein